jgi:hypothetical protein
VGRGRHDGDSHVGGGVQLCRPARSGGARRLAGRAGHAAAADHRRLRGHRHPGLAGRVHAERTGTAVRSRERDRRDHHLGRRQRLLPRHPGRCDRHGLAGRGHRRRRPRRRARPTCPPGRARWSYGPAHRGRREGRDGPARPAKRGPASASPRLPKDSSKRCGRRLLARSGCRAGRLWAKSNGQRALAAQSSTDLGSASGEANPTGNPGRRVDGGGVPLPTPERVGVNSSRTAPEPLWRESARRPGGRVCGLLPPSPYDVRVRSGGR